VVALGSAGCVVRGVGGGVGGVGGGGGALSVGSGGVCRLADSRLACFARCYQRLPHFAWRAMYRTIVNI